MNTAIAIIFVAVCALPPTVTCLIGIFLQRHDGRQFRTEMAVTGRGAEAVS